MANLESGCFFIPDIPACNLRYIPGQPTRLLDEINKALSLIERPYKNLKKYAFEVENQVITFRIPEKANPSKYINRMRYPEILSMEYKVGYEAIVKLYVPKYVTILSIGFKKQ